MSQRWDEFFLGMALSVATQSKDPSTRVGAVLVRDNIAICPGFNGFPRGIADTPERLADKVIKNSLMMHAEENAILNAARLGVSTVGSTLYLAATDASGKVWSGPPCAHCCLRVIQAGIVEVVGWPFKEGPSSWRLSIEAGRKLLEEAGIVYREVSSAEL